LTLGDYLWATVKHPTLLTQAPATRVANIEKVVAHFREDGLTLKAYVRAAVKSRSLFQQSPSTIVANLEKVVAHFREDGLTLKAYIEAAARQPPLFYQSPGTIIGHVTLIIDLHKEGWVTFPGEADAPPAYPLKPMFDFLVKRPTLFCLADDNYALRKTYARVTGGRFKGASLLTRSRQQIERALIEAVGHAYADAILAAQPPGKKNGES
jgi:hypothetical protein